MAVESSSPEPNDAVRCHGPAASTAVPADSCRGPWPEDDDAPPYPYDRREGCAAHAACPSFLARWSFSYMNPVLRKGADVHRAATKKRKRQREERRRVVVPRKRSSAASDSNSIGEENCGSATVGRNEEDNGDEDGDDAENDDGVDASSLSSPASYSSSPQQLQLTPSDLYSVPSAMRTSVLRPAFHSEYAASHRDLVRTLWRLAGPTFLPAGFAQLVTVVAQVATPMFVWRLLRILEANPSSNVFREAVPYVALVLVADVANAYGTHRQRFLATQSGATIRAALVIAVYERILRLTPRGRRGLTTGAATTLFAVDAQKIFEVTSEGHLLWSAPLSMLLVGVALMVVVGPSMAVGVALLLLFVPVVRAITNRMMEIRKERVAVTDARADVVNAMLQGIKVTKLNNYESRYVERMAEVRESELGLLRRELYVWSVTMAVQFISPVVASAGAFAAYVLAGNLLTTADAFTALLLFNALRFPINYASRLVGKVAQARESARRISIFMRREVRGGTIDDLGDGGGGVVAKSLAIAGPTPFNKRKTFRNGVEGSQNDTTDSTLGSTQATSSNNRERSTINGSAHPSSVVTTDKDDVPSSLSSSHNNDKNNRNNSSGNTNGSDSSSSSNNNISNNSIRINKGNDDDENDDKSPLLVIKDGVFYAGAAADNDPDSVQSWDEIASAGVSPNEGGFTVAGVNASVSAGEVLAIVGPVGSGKSTIVNAVIGEISASPGTTIRTAGRVAYASQVAFVLNATLRENVTFGNEWDPERYERVLDACCLRTDIEQLRAGDMTEIGERGVTLSGGQKQRVSLARAVYSDPDVALLDDPLSALDAGTARTVFDRLFDRRNGDRDRLLSKTAVVLVTHASHFLNRVNRVMVVVDGRVPFCGTWEELSAAGARGMEDDKARVAVESILNAVQEGEVAVSEGDSDDTPGGNKGFDRSVPPRSVHGKADVEALMSRETREHGLTQNWAWMLWFHHAGGRFFTFGLILLFVTEKVFYFGTEWWVSIWTEAVDTPIEVAGTWFPPQTEGKLAQYEYLKIYGIMMLLGFVCALLRTVWIVSGGIRCSKDLYATMTRCVLHSPMVYFETTPMGRLLNRFTYDAEILDVTLVWSMSMLLIAASWFVTALVVMVVILPWMCLVLIPISVLYVFIHRHYRKSGADLQRLDALSRSPLQTMLAEGIEGSATIRTFGKEATFVQRFQGFADKSTAAQMNFLGAQRWLGVRVELMGAVIVFSASLLVIVFNASFGLGAGLVALLIRWSAGFTVSLSFLLDNAAEAEGAVTAIERIQKMSEIKQELNFERRGDLVDGSWPSRGELEFRDVRMRYRPRLPLSLDGLSFRVEAGEHCGVVGRTGAGKSSLLTALFRLVEVEGGAMFVDGVDVSRIGLSDVRGRPDGISIIPQDPFLFAGTLRECLDPFGAFSDVKLTEALASVRMLPSQNGMEILDSRVEEGGTNYSVGERSLLVLARAMLARPKLLLMDEATANIDGETDSFIQRMLRTRFTETTLLTIAHRLETIMDYDKILVVENGKAAEFGVPSELIENNGMFTQLVNATGEGAAALIAMAKEAKEKKRIAITFEEHKK